jgi:cob(I)alamin adenosyltransferase
MAIYTKTGDDGDTALFGGGRVPKDHRRVEAYGAVDELNSFVGLALTSLIDDDDDVRRGLLLIQNDLFALGANLATPGGDDSRPRPQTPDVPVARVETMEEWIDRATEQLPELRRFILPGGTEAAAMLHVCRSVCRRAERAVVALGREEPLDQGILPYLNRLSDLLFVWARLENFRAGQADVPWGND